MSKKSSSTAMPTVWVGTDVRVIRRDGAYIATHPALNDQVIDRCRAAGTRVVLVAREVDSWETEASNISAMDDIALLQDGPGGPLRRLFYLVSQVFRLHVTRHDAVVTRIPEVIGTSLWARGLLARCATVANFVAEGPAAIHFLGRSSPRLHPIFERMCQVIARMSTATVYVTRSLLQERYPPKSPLTIAQSNVQLPEDWHQGGPRAFTDGEARRLVAIGTLESNGKGIDLLIRALELAGREVQGLSLTVVGDGSSRSDLEALARHLKVQDQVRFAGFLSTKEELAAVLDARDLLVMPSRFEGLPRAAVEAQARGLPCLASDVGGLPEVVPAEGIHHVGDVDELARMTVRAHRDGDYTTRLAADGYRLAIEIKDAAHPRRFTRLVQEAMARKKDDSGQKSTDDS